MKEVYFNSPNNMFYQDTLTANSLIVFFILFAQRVFLAPFFMLFRFDMLFL